MISAAIVGATGYTGSVLTRILCRHPSVEPNVLTSMSYEGQTVGEVFPDIRFAGRYTQYEVAEIKGCDVAFVCYPHGRAHPVVSELIDSGVRVVDLSADFRLRDVGLYEEWYDFSHPRSDLVSEAVYGLPELHRNRIGSARLVANPGCFPTATLLGLLPLTEKIDLESLVVDAKSGTSGAGRVPSEKTHFGNVHDNFRAYAETGHRHIPEMTEQLQMAGAGEVGVSFTPHLLPVNRGILATLYCPVQPAATALDLEDLYARRYAEEPFVEPVATTPSLHEVQYTNYCRVAVRRDPAAGMIKIFAALDNLVKGASGQAVQNMNIMFGRPETEGLEVPA